MKHTCPACGTPTDARTCCGIPLSAPFHMTRALIVALRRYAHGRKGLDEPTYRLHLHAVGAASTTTLTRTQRDQLLLRLGKLPDAPRKPARAAQ